MIRGGIGDVLDFEYVVIRAILTEVDAFFKAGGGELERLLQMGSKVPGPCSE